MADNPLDFQSAHDRKHGPDAEFVYRDERGCSWFKFTCSYRDGEDEFCFEIWALNVADAERRLRAICQTAKVDGQLFHEVPA